MDVLKIFSCSLCKKWTYEFANKEHPWLAPPIPARRNPQVTVIICPFCKPSDAFVPGTSQVVEGSRRVV